MREIDPTFGEMCADYSRENAEPIRAGVDSENT
jgi:hypothetical protein